MPMNVFNSGLPRFERVLYMHDSGRTEGDSEVSTHPSLPTFSQTAARK